MSDRFEWLRAESKPTGVPAGFRDRYGLRVDPGNLGVFLDNAIIEGTPAEFRTLIARLTALVDKADPSGRYIPHPTSTVLPQVEPIEWPNVTWEAWSDGYAVGYKATHTDGRIEYVYLNASGDDLGSEASPCAFLYHDDSGDQNDGETVCYVDVFADEQPDVDPEPLRVRATDDPDYDEAEQQQAEQDDAFDPQAPDEVPDERFWRSTASTPGPPGYPERNGTKLRSVRPLDPALHDKEATGPMYEVEFMDGVKAHAYEDEIVRY